MTTIPLSKYNNYIFVLGEDSSITNTIVSHNLEKMLQDMMKYVVFRSTYRTRFHTGSKKCDLGIVDCIFILHYYQIILCNRINRASTTPILMRHDPLPAAAKIFTIGISKTNYIYMTISSGAGHDAQPISHKVPTAMLFIPSRNGKSHCPEEYTAVESLVKAVHVLQKTINTKQESTMLTSISNFISDSSKGYSPIRNRFISLYTLINAVPN